MCLFWIKIIFIKWIINLLSPDLVNLFSSSCIFFLFFSLIVQIIPTARTIIVSEEVNDNRWKCNGRGGRSGERGRRRWTVKIDRQKSILNRRESSFPYRPPTSRYVLLHLVESKVIFLVYRFSPIFLSPSLYTVYRINQLSIER